MDELDLYVITLDLHRNHHFKYKMTPSGLVLAMHHLQIFSNNNTVMYSFCIVVGMAHNQPLKVVILVVMISLYIDSTIS